MENSFFSALQSAIAESEAGDTAPPALPMRDAQADYLRTFVASVKQQVTFKRGDFVRYREGAGPLKKELSEQLALIYWRSLDTSEDNEDYWRIQQANAAEVTMLPTLDCMIAVFLPQGLTFWLSCSTLLEKSEP